MNAEKAFDKFQDENVKKVGSQRNTIILKVVYTKLLSSITLNKDVI